MLLVEGQFFNTSLCKCCQRVGLFYKNVLVGFDLTEFLSFCKGIVKMDFHTHCVPFPNGREYVVIQTCHADIQFCFNAEEFEELSQLLMESQRMIEVHQSLETT